jgi:multidrug resistance efflux pump
MQAGLIPGARIALLALGTPDKGPYTPAATWPEGRADVRGLAAAAERALVHRQGVILHRPEGTRVAWPILVGGSLVGTVAVELRADDEVEAGAALAQLQWGTGWLETLYLRERGGQAGADTTRLTTVMDLVAVAVDQDGFQASASAFATETATRLLCDRVSVGFVQRGQLRVRALSHTAQFDKKTNVVRAIESLMEEAYDQEQRVVFPPLPDTGFQVTLAHETVMRDYGAGALCTVLFGREGAILGAITFERPGSRPFDARDVELCEAVAALCGPVLEAERRASRWIGAQAWEAARRHFAKLTEPEHGLLKLVAGTLLALTVFFAFARMEYRVSADTAIEAERQRVAVAPFDGYVVEAPLRAGDTVTEGDLLAVLDDRDLQLERQRYASQAEQYAQSRAQALAKGERAEARILGAQMDEAAAQLARVDDQLARTRVLAPVSGLIVAGDLSQAIGSPTERGQVLFEVAPTDRYRVILEVDERDVADVAVGQTGRLVLSAFPSEPLDFQVTRVTPVSQAKDGRNVFRVEAELDSADTRLRPGMEGVGKIDAGSRRIIWIWTHSALDWLRLTFWRWTP